MRLPLRESAACGWDESDVFTVFTWEGLLRGGGKQAPFQTRLFTHSVNLNKLPLQAEVPA